MKAAHFTTLVIMAMTVASCATLGPVGNLESGKLVRYDCDGHDFSARIADDYTSVRLRTHEGSINLDRVEGDEFKGDGWVLKTQGGLQLIHKEKIVASSCKKEV